MESKLPNTNVINLSKSSEFLQNRGYEVDKELRDSERYKAYKVHKNGRSYFFKITDNVNLSKIKGEIWFSDFINSQGLESLVAPHVVESGENWFISEYFNTDPLCNEADCYRSDITAYIAAMASIIKQIDGFVLPESVHSPSKDRFDIGPVDRVSMVALEKGVITPALRSKALDIIGDKLKYAEKRVQHGDFTPWHIYDLGNGTFGLIDSEHAGKWPRFNDLAGIYTRIFNRCNSPETAAKLLSNLLASIDMAEERFFDQFLAVLTKKALFGCYDATRDWVKHDYKASARELVERCVSKNLTALTEAKN